MQSMATFVCACCRRDAEGEQYGALVRGTGAISNVKYRLLRKGALVRLFPICSVCANEIAREINMLRTPSMSSGISAHA